MAEITFELFQRGKKAKAELKTQAQSFIRHEYYAYWKEQRIALLKKLEAKVWDGTLTFADLRKTLQQEISIAESDAKP